VYEDLFLPSQRCLTLAEERLAILTQSIHLVSYNSVADNTVYLHSFSCYCLSETREMSRNSKRIWPYSS